MAASPSFTMRFRSMAPWWVLALILTIVISSRLSGCGAEPPQGNDFDAPFDAGTDEPIDVQRDEPIDALSDAPFDATFPAGTWYLAADGARLVLTLGHSGSGYAGTVANEGEGSEKLSNVAWDSTGRWLEFRRDRSDSFEWYRMSVVDGVASGRYARGATSGKPPLTQYVAHVTGWSPTFIDTDIVPRTWQVVLNGVLKGVLRIDRDAAGVLRGRLKVVDSGAPDATESLEYDLDRVTWDGTILSFQRIDAAWTEVYTGTAEGRFISGTFTRNGAPSAWSGTRAEVLGFGLGSRLSQRATWQEQTRHRILNLTEGMSLGGTSVPAVTVTTEDCPDCPFTDGPYAAERDDDPEAWPPYYQLARLRFSVLPGNRFDGDHPPPAREFFGYLATPTTEPPPGGYPVLIALSGHGGDARQLMTKSDNFFWYGESAARHGMVVLALEFSHRPEWNYGPVFQPAIVGAGYTSSDWEENGERTFSVRRAADYLATLPNLRMDQLVISALSGGAEIAAITAALDARFAMAIAAAYPPDTYVMDYHGNHPCYRWDHADLHEYVSSSDYEALVAPRPLVLETGLQDFTYSSLATPWAGDKQAARRARAAYGDDARNLTHYLTYDGHAFHVGDKNSRFPDRPRGVQVPSVIEPTGVGSLDWQTNLETLLRRPTLYDLMNELLPDRPLARRALMRTPPASRSAADR